MIKTSNEIGALATALSEAQGKIQNPSKDANNPFFKSKYADLAEVLNVVRPVFSEVGLSVVQFPSRIENNIALTTRIMHKSGEWIEDTFDLAFQGKNIAQEAGSTISYMRRYALASAAGIFQEDNDGNLGKSKTDNTAKTQPLQAPKMNMVQLEVLADKKGADWDKIKSWVEGSGSINDAIAQLESRADVTNPELPTFDDALKAHFDKTIADSDALEMYVIQRNTDAAIFTNLYNSFEQGTKVKFKKIVDELAEKGKDAFEEYIKLTQEGHNTEDEVSSEAWALIKSEAS